MGRGQVVRQRVLVPVFGGSNPSVPEYTYYIYHIRLCISYQNTYFISVYKIVFFLFFHVYFKQLSLFY